MSSLTPSKENGTRLVGQCEISHPVNGAGVRITFEDESDPRMSPADDLDGTIGKPRNVLFESSKKDEYEPLDARISRTHAHRSCATEMLIRTLQGYFTSTRMAAKSILHQMRIISRTYQNLMSWCIRAVRCGPGELPHPAPRGFVTGRQHRLTSAPVSFPAWLSAVYPTPSHARGLSERKFFCVSSTCLTIPVCFTALTPRSELAE